VQDGVNRSCASTLMGISAVIPRRRWLDRRFDVVPSEFISEHLEPELKPAGLDGRSWFGLVKTPKIQSMEGK